MILFVSRSLSNPISDPCCYATPLANATSIPDKTKDFDFVIVGGGTAGCVLASSLS